MTVTYNVHKSQSIDILCHVPQFHMEFDSETGYAQSFKWQVPSPTVNFRPNGCKENCQGF